MWTQKSKARRFAYMKRSRTPLQGEFLVGFPGVKTPGFSPVAPSGQRAIDPEWIGSPIPAGQ